MSPSLLIFFPFSTWTAQVFHTFRNKPISFHYPVDFFITTTMNFYLYRYNGLNSLTPFWTLLVFPQSVILWCLGLSLGGVQFHILIKTLNFTRIAIISSSQARGFGKPQDRKKWLGPSFWTPRLPFFSFIYIIILVPAEPEQEKEDNEGRIFLLGGGPAKRALHSLSWQTF